MNARLVYHVLWVYQLSILSSAHLFRGKKVNPNLNNIQSALSSSKRIIGGYKVDDASFSYTVSLQDSDGHFCGGSLIARDFVLTAAHCYEADYVVVGRYDLDTNDGEEISVRKEIEHPDYDSKTDEFDIMLMQLDYMVSVDVAIVNINSNDLLPEDGTTVTTMGWGDTDDDPDKYKGSDDLRAVEVGAITNKECEESEGKYDGRTRTYDGRIFDSMVCAIADDKDSCQGDSGGALVIRGDDPTGADDVQVGIVSFGKGCATGIFPGVYSRVSKAHDWIKDIVCEKSAQPPTGLCGGDTVIPTTSPTTPPTTSPTTSPTMDPTSSPTSSPTKEPTPGTPTGSSASPTNSPTPFPTGGPTNSPVSVPTNEPTASPTQKPTKKSKARKN